MNRTIQRKKHAAKKRGIDWQITEEEYANLRKITKCFYTDINLVISKDATQNYNTWTLDRIDANGPYHINNVVVCSRDANMIKNVLCQEQLKSFDPKHINSVMEKLSFQRQITVKSKFKQILEILFK